MSEFPTGLARDCAQFAGREVTVRLKSGWGWQHFLEGIQQRFTSKPAYSSGDLTVRVESFFEHNGLLRGFTAGVRKQGHPLHGLRAVLFTMSDGKDFDFTENVCMAWRAVFGEQEPHAGASSIPEFGTGNV